MSDLRQPSVLAEQASYRLVATSRTVALLPGLQDLLGVRVDYFRGPGKPVACSGVIAWGRKPTARRAERLADRYGLPLFRVEDGFLRSVGLGKQDPPLSVVVDDLGIYYDASAPSRLESLISASFSPLQRARAVELMAGWRAGRVSKYNHGREHVPAFLKPFLEEGEKPYVLAVDQTAGDASLHYGWAEKTSFQRMLDAALNENPGCAVLLKVHPEVVLGRKKGHFDLKALARNPRVIVVGENLHPVPLIERAEAVYTVTSQVGFEGLLWGKRVRTFGMPFYAGWGQTEDELPAPSRRHPVPLEDVIYGALIAYPRYIDIETGHPCGPERVLEWMTFQRRMLERFPPVVYGAGFSPYKRPIVRSFFQGSSVQFVRNSAQIPLGETVAAWGRKSFQSSQLGPEEKGTTAFEDGCGDNSRSEIRLEDGFIRSVGLGADLIRPLSWVMDRRGIYYDATQPSDLECLLQESSFDEGLIQRARELRRRIVDAGLTKYNVGSERWRRPDIRGNASGRTASRVILVPGQVESDASIRYGASFIRTNMGLLQAVRRANPDAYVVYKPHPDVQTGLRSEGEDEGDATKWCDELVHDVPMQVLLDAVDEVHVLTSLSGFEALLRGKLVTTYGQPFYAGWGLTHDMGLVPEVARRRTRRLSLDELVGGALILYPTYVSRVTGRFTTPERALDELLVWRQHGDSGSSAWRKVLRVLLRLVKPTG